MGRERRAGRYATPMTSRWTVDTVAWLLNDVARKRRGNGCGMRLAHARVRLPSEPIFISFYMEWRYRRHPVSARGLRTCSHVWRTDEIPGVSSCDKRHRCSRMVYPFGRGRSWRPPGRRSGDVGHRLRQEAYHWFRSKRRRWKRSDTKSTNPPWPAGPPHSGPGRR